MELDGYSNIVMFFKDSFKNTREWLKRNLNPEKSNENKNDILSSAFIELLKRSDLPFPEVNTFKFNRYILSSGF